MNPATVGKEWQWSAKAVHRGLLTQFIFLWFCVTVHLHVVMHDELWPHGPVARIMAAVPPIAPFVLIVGGKVAPAAITGAATLVTAALWVVAVRHPQVTIIRVPARFAVLAYWLLLWFPMALSA